MDLNQQTTVSTNITPLMANLKLQDDTSIIWIDNLKLEYYDANFRIEIPADEIHGQLKSTCNVLKDKIKSKLWNSKTLLDEDGDPKPNIIAANIGFILSKPNKYGEIFVSLPVEVVSHYYYSIRYSWYADEGVKDKLGQRNFTRSSRSAERIQERHDAGRRQTLQNISSFTDYQINGPMFYYKNDINTYNRKFHHSEQSLFEFLCRRNTATDLSKKLVHTFNQDIPIKNQGITILTIILDIHSTRYICENCELSLMGMMNPNYVFLQNMTAELRRHGFQYNPKDAELIPRVSANKPFGKNGKKKTMQDHRSLSELKAMDHRWHVVKNKYIYQADTSTYNTSDVDIDLCQRTIFISTYVTHQSVYKRTLGNKRTEEKAPQYHKVDSLSDTVNKQIPFSKEELLNAKCIVQRTKEYRTIADSDSIEMLKSIGVSFHTIAEFNEQQQEFCLELLEEKQITPDELNLFSVKDLEFVFANSSRLENLCQMFRELNCDKDKLMTRLHSNIGEVVDLLLENAPDVDVIVLSYAKKDDIDFVLSQLSETEAEIFKVNLSTHGYDDPEIFGYDHNQEEAANYSAVQYNKDTSKITNF